MSNQFKYRIGAQIRRFWHDVYYALAPNKAREFALTCKEATEHVDVGHSKKRIGRTRYWLHMSLCQGCRNYARTTAALKSAVKSVLTSHPAPERLDRLNKKLLAKYTESKD